MALWSSAEINNLPDSSFAIIEKGGKKDEDGKTEPRSLRHLPYKGPDGKVNLPHLRNALARLSQTKLSPELIAEARKKLEAAAKENDVGDYSGEYSEEELSEIPVTFAEHDEALYGKVTVGKPIFIAREAQFIHRRGITGQELDEMLENFNNRAVGLDINIDYEHGEDPTKGKKAAGWIKSIFKSTINIKGEKVKALFAIPEWTPAAAKAIDEREYRYTSPEVVWNFKNSENGQNFGTVLRRVAILNGPQFAEQPSIKLSEQKVDGKKNLTKGENGKMKNLIALLESKGAKFSATSETTESEIVAAFKEVVSKLEDSKLAAETKLGTLETKFSALEKEAGTLKEKAGKFEALEAKTKADAVAALVERAKEKMEPAKAESTFKALAEKDFKFAEDFLASIDSVKFAAKKGEPKTASGDDDEDGDPEEMKAEEIQKIREKMADKQKVAVDKISYRAAMNEWLENQKDSKK